MIKWFLMLMVWIPRVVLGQETSPLKTPLTSEQISEKDRFHWRSIIRSSVLPDPVSFPLVQQAIEGRTSLILHPERQWVLYQPAILRQYPFLHWEMCGLPPQLSLEDKLHFRDFFNAGGTLYFDYCEETADYAAWKAWGALIYPDTKWEELNKSNVLAFSFYLLEKRILLNRGHSSLFVLENDERFIMVFNQDARFAWKIFQQSAISKNYNTPLNEIRLRFYINLMMYLLTGNYKSDQLHLPTILLRRK